MAFGATREVAAIIVGHFVCLRKKELAPF